jgi:alkylation response protein AidB-like acyl-CoA dehydrogenase
MAESSVTPGGVFLMEGPAADCIFTPEQFGAEARLMAETADGFLRKEVLPHTERLENHDIELMGRLMRKAGELGLLGADVPEVYGGLGLDMRTSALLAEKLNWQQSFALSHEAHTVIATLPLMFFGSQEQKLKYLPKLATGEWIGCFALSEAGSGSDALGAQTRATLSEDGREWILNGTKAWITNTAFASLFTVFAKVDGDNFSAFLVERDTPGVSFGKEEHKLGMKGTSTRRVILEDVRIPRENLIGEVGKGHYAAFCALNMGRFKLEAGAVGGIKESLAVCAAYANQRRQFGRPIASFPLIQAKLGEICARLFALESGVYRLAGLLDGLFEGIDPTARDASARYHRAAEEYAVECGVVKVVGSELYSLATDEGIQIHGGYGYTEEFPMARAWRDHRLLRIGEGANEVVRINIVSTLLRRAKMGRLDLGHAMEEARKVNAADVRAVPDGPELAGRQKIAALILLGEAQRAFGDSLLDEQETVAAIADIIAAAYCAESAWVRVEKLQARGATVDLAEDAARFYTESALHDAQRGTDLILAHLPSDDLSELRETLNALYTSHRPADLITLRRRLAEAVLEREAYLW